MIFFSEIDLIIGDITETVAQKSGDLQFQNILQLSAQLLICALWPTEAHEFEVILYFSAVNFKKYIFLFLYYKKGSVH